MAESDARVNRFQERSTALVHAIEAKDKKLSEVEAEKKCFVDALQAVNKLAEGEDVRRTRALELKNRWMDTLAKCGHDSPNAEVSKNEEAPAQTDAGGGTAKASEVGPTALSKPYPTLRLVAASTQLCHQQRVRDPSQRRRNDDEERWGNYFNCVFSLEIRKQQLRQRQRTQGELDPGGWPA